MAHVDRRLGPAGLRTPWSGSRERERGARRRWRRSSPGTPRPAPARCWPPSRQLGAEVDAAGRRDGSRCAASPTGSRSTRTAGWWWSTSRPARPADRGRARRAPPARPLPARRRARRRSTTSPGRGRTASGGAELVQLRHEEPGGRGCRRSQAQPPQEPDADGATLVEVPADRRPSAAIRDETFPARPGDALRPLRLPSRSARSRAPGRCCRERPAAAPARSGSCRPSWAHGFPFSAAAVRRDHRAARAGGRHRRRRLRQDHR